MSDAPRDHLALFPLSNVVLFPKVRVPLHIFEPRYRQLARYALDGDRRIGMIAVHPEHVGEMSGSPRVFEVGCEGVIEQAAELPDGRINLVLLGERRFRILEELPSDESRLYRLAAVEPLEDSDSPEELERVTERRGEVLDLLVRLLHLIAPDRAGEVSEQQFEGVDSPTFVNAVSQAIDFRPSEKQALLETNSVSDRCDRLIETLRFRLAEHAAGPAPTHDVLH